MADDQVISICDVMKNDSLKMINKLEAVGPVQYQLFSDIYIDHLQFIKKMFNVCLMSEKRFFDKLNINEDVLGNIKSSSDHITKIVTDQIENYSRWMELYAQVRVVGMESYNQYTTVMMEVYSTTLNSFTKLNK